MGRKTYSASFGNRGQSMNVVLISSILLIASFLVLLLFIYKVNFKDLSEEQVCQASVALSNEKSFFRGLECKTDYACLSGGGACSGITYRDETELKVESVQKAKEEVMKEIAERMESCWWMFGEGKVNYRLWVERGTLSKVCAVCSEFAFDSVLRDLKIEITYEEFYSFLENTPRGEGKNKYLEYFGGKIYSKPSGKMDLSKIYGIYTWQANSMDSVPLALLERENVGSLSCDFFVTS